ncbi:MAG: RrF2 family transcriptional regulator, partial [Treponemataceae bacterium]|nr:RrF2 family transcriptional regulator [Treponemataceae bacterium]
YLVVQWVIMIVSTRGRYALRVMIDLAEHQQDGYIPLKEIAERQEISQKYIEAIMTLLSKAGMVDAMHGKGGGYRLNRSPAEYKVRELLELTEGSLAPVACLECDAEKCPREENCRTLPLWKELNNRITGYLETVSLADLARL